MKNKFPTVAYKISLTLSLHLGKLLAYYFIIFKFMYQIETNALPISASAQSD